MGGSVHAVQRSAATGRGGGGRGLVGGSVHSVQRWGGEVAAQLSGGSSPPSAAQCSNRYGCSWADAWQPGNTAGQLYRNRHAGQ